MTDPTESMTDPELKAQSSRFYRVNGKVVEAWHDGKWIAAYYCSSEEGAVLRREKCISRRIEWMKMTNEERQRAILR